jgi:hypothetical protein
LDAIDQQAVAHARAVIRALLPAADGALLVPELALLPIRVRTAGLGGLVARSTAPPGDIVARRVQADAFVRARTSDGARLDEAVSRVTDAMAGDEAARRAGGLLDLQLAELGPATTSAGAGGPVFTRELRFRLLFEHVHRPAEAGDVIDRIPQSVVLDSEP